MKYLVLFIIELFLVIGSRGIDVSKITPWLLGINFTVAFFSINFTFFGYQLSKYKALYQHITSRQWFNIFTIIALPFLPVITLLISEKIFGLIALWILPVLCWSAIDNAQLTLKYLSPDEYLKRNFNGDNIKQYIKRLKKEVEKESGAHQKYLDNKDKFQIPSHAFDFKPGILGCPKNDLWDSITVIIKLSIENNDYPVFRKSVTSTLELLKEFYRFDSGGESGYKINGAIQHIARNRLRSIISRINSDDKELIFLQSLSNELCSFLMEDYALEDSLSDITSSVASDVVMISKTIMHSENSFEPIKALNTIHAVIELSIYRLENNNSGDIKNTVDRYNISFYAFLIQSLAIEALKTENTHFAYRCMETLSYLGCNAAKHKARTTVAATFESLAQIARVARSKNAGCFWSRCIIPIEKHAEEFLGHILTWCIQDINKDGKFFLKSAAEQTYSRIRGIECSIKPISNYSPAFWINQVKDEKGEYKPHIETLLGAHGYGGSIDYSDYSCLQEYKLSDHD